MSKRTIGGWIVAVLTLTTIVLAQTNQVEQRYTFKAANGSKSGPSGEGRLELVITRWSTDAERARLLSALREGPNKLADAIRAGYAVGYMHSPGGLDYTLRYAYRVPNPDGGEDVVLGTDQPIRLWWDSGSATPSSSQATVIQLRLNRDGRGEGKLGTNVTNHHKAKTFVIENFDALPATLVDVQRERSSTATSS